MSTTIQQGLRPLFLMCFIVGLGVYPIKQPIKSRFHRWVVYLNILYFLVIWFVYGCVFFYTFTIFSLKILLGSIFTFINLIVINNFTVISSAISIFYHQKKFQIYMKKLAAVDDTLEKLGTPKTYRKLHMLSKRVIIGWIVHTIIINICSMICWFEYLKVSSKTLLLSILYYPNNIHEFINLIFIFLLWYIGTRFDEINYHMHCLLLKEECGPKYIGKKPVIIHEYFLHRHNYKRTFWTSMHLYLELCRIARELNVIFGIPITLKMMISLVHLTTYCYYLWRALDKLSLVTLISLCSWFFTWLISTYAANHICESVKNKANSFDKIIHQFTNTLRYADMWNEIDYFVLQIMHHPLKFTGLDLFYLGNKFFQKFFTTTVTFIIIMEQLNVNI